MARCASIGLGSGPAFCGSVSRPGPGRISILTLLVCADLDGPLNPSCSWFPQHLRNLPESATSTTPTESRIVARRCGWVVAVVLIAGTFSAVLGKARAFWLGYLAADRAVHESALSVAAAAYAMCTARSGSWSTVMWRSACAGISAGCSVASAAASFPTLLRTAELVFATTDRLRIAAGLGTVFFGLFADVKISPGVALREASCFFPRGDA